MSGSLEAFEDEIARLPQQDVQVQVLRSGVGGITESDVDLAAASDAIILGFNVRPVGDARAAADREGVEIRGYSVIYKAIDELRDAMEGLLAPEEVEETVATVEVRAIFRASKIGTIAGSYVTEGKITRGSKIRLVRDGTVVYERRDRVAAAPAGRRPRGRGRVRVRHRAARLRRRQGGRRDRGVPDQTGGADARVAGGRAVFVAVLRIELFFPDAGSLKSRRAELRPVKAALRQRLGCAVAEVADGGETWQRATLAASVVGSSQRDVCESADRVQRYLDGHLSHGARIDRIVASWNDLGGVG